MVPNRRLGDRILVGAMPLTWAPADGEIPTLRVPVQRALLMELSVTGAGLFGPSDPWVGVEDLAIVGFDDGRALARVRRVSRTNDKSLNYFGVEFVSMDDWFQRDVYEVIGRGRPSPR